MILFIVFFLFAQYNSVILKMSHVKSYKLFYTLMVLHWLPITLHQLHVILITFNSFKAMLSAMSSCQLVNQFTSVYCSAKIPGNSERVQVLVCSIHENILGIARI